MTIKTVQLRIHGKVQGVWYRGWAVDLARELGIEGWVRNRHDGTVEAVLSGPQAAVERMIEACSQGPRAAEVTKIDIEDRPPFEGNGFQQRASE